MLSGPLLIAILSIMLESSSVSEGLVDAVLRMWTNQTNEAGRRLTLTAASGLALGLKTGFGVMQILMRHCRELLLSGILEGGCILSKVFKTSLQRGALIFGLGKMCLQSGPGFGVASIAVLPFVNLRTRTDLEAFVDGLTEDIITGLSRIKALWVIAAGTMLTYKSMTVLNVSEVGSELGVRYVLEGSVRKSGNRLRMSAQLIEAETGHHVWAEQINRAEEDLFEVQDEFTRGVGLRCRRN